MEGRDKFAGWVLPLSKTLLALASIVGLLGWGYVALLSLAWFGRPKDLPQAFFLAFPFVYLLFSLFACFKAMSRRALLISGVGLNLPLMMAGLYFIFKSPEGVLATAICFAFIILWALMCLARAYTANA